MYVGNNKQGIQLSQSIYEDNFSNDIILFTDNKKRSLNNFILPNIFKQKHKFIYVDYERNIYDKKLNNKDVEIIDLNDLTYSYNPLSNIKNESDISFIINFILYNYKFKTQINKEMFIGGITNLLNALFIYIYTYQEDKLSFDNVCRLLENMMDKENEKNNTDIIFSEAINNGLFINNAIRKYFLFKTLPMKVQKEIINQAYTLMLNIVNIPFINTINSLSIDGFLSSNKSLIILPHKEECKLNFQITDLLLCQIIAFRNIETLKNNTTLQTNNNYAKNIQIILNSSINYKHHKNLIKMFCTVHENISINLLLPSIQVGYNLFGNYLNDFIRKTNYLLYTQIKDKNTIEFLKKIDGYNNNLSNSYINILHKNNEKYDMVTDNLITGFEIDNIELNKSILFKENIQNNLKSKHTRNKNISSWNIGTQNHKSL